MDTQKSPIETACDMVGSQAEMARILDLSPAMINQLVKGHRPVPVAHCKAIQKATGGRVTCIDLRPNDWREIWPEMAQDPDTIAPEATETVAEQGAAHV